MANGDAQETGTSGGGKVQAIIAVAILTLIAGAGGALVGTLLGGTEAPVETAAREDETANTIDAHAASAQPSAEAHGDSDESEMTASGLRILALQPVLTNLYAPAGTWIRVEADLVVRDHVEDGEPVDDAVLAAQIQADTLAFLRTVQLAQIDGTRGLLHLAEDLRERARLRSPAVVDYLIRTLVAE